MYYLNIFDLERTTKKRSTQQQHILWDFILGVYCQGLMGGTFVPVCSQGKNERSFEN